MKKTDRQQSLNVAVEEIDQEHKEIEKILNHLMSDPEANVRSETISESLHRLTKYALTHFTTEEELMEKHGYPDLAAHKIAHVAFQERMFMFCYNTMTHQPTVPFELFQYIKDWLEDHIIVEDMKYLSFFEERGFI